MLQTLETFMTQSPDVQGVTIDFGDAPAHGRWRVTSMLVTFESGRYRTWRTRWYDAYGGHLSFGFTYAPPHGERVVHIQLKSWELKE